MTTPFQPAPDGAYVIGGGTAEPGDVSAYGQDLDDQSVAHLLTGGFSEIANISDPLQQVSSSIAKAKDSLSVLPVEVLQEFKGLVPDATDDEFDTSRNAATRLTDHFKTLGPLKKNTFRDWVGNTFHKFLGSGTSDVSEDTDSESAVQRIFDTLLHHTRQLQDLQVSSVGGRYAGTTVTVDFSTYPDGDLPSEFVVNYFGSGTSTVGIIDGEAGWNLVNDGDRGANAIYNTPTDTDFQTIHGTMAAPPSGAGSGGGTPRVWCVARGNSTNPDTFVFARSYKTGWLQYKADIGCYVGGVEYIWGSDIPLTWSMDIYLLVGVGSDANKFELYSGNKLVTSYTDAAAQSSVGAGFRYWGSRTEMKTSTDGAVGPGTIAGTSVTDNQPPDLVGPTALMYRSSTANVSLPGNASGWVVLASNFFGSAAYHSPDITADLTNGSFTVTKAGTYIINGRVLLTSAVNALIKLGVAVNGSLVKARSGQAWSSDTAGQCIEGTFSVYLEAGDVVQLMTRSSTTTFNELTGEATGTETYFDIAAANLSYL